MKKSVFALFLTIITISFAYAGDVIKVLRVYSDGKCTSIPLAGVDSLDHSMYDADGKLYSQYTSSVIHAIDRDYLIPINSIDKVVIGEIDVQEYEAQINEINDFINEQTELEVNAFQANLLSWLNANENIQEATINENKDLITTIFKNGLDFYINFQDMAFYKEGSTEAKANIRRTPKDEESNVGYYDVSFQEEEEIVESPKILYIKGMDMIGSSLIYTSEWYFINKRINNSPVKCVLEDSNESLDFVKKNFENYGLIIISQTHGGGEGSFMISRPIAHNASDVDPQESSISKAFAIYYENREDITEHEYKIVVPIPKTKYSITIYSEPVYLIRSSLIDKKTKGNKKTIIYANYCWSAGLTKFVKDNTIIGFETKTQYFNNWGYTVDYLDFFLKGNIYGDFIKEVQPYDYDEAEGGKVIPSTNHPDSKQRYFSIQTDEITERAANGQPIISGKINGYKNLKKDDLTYLIYFHKGDGAFSPENAQEDECMVLKIPGRNDISDFEINEDGSFSFEFPGFLLDNTKYQMIFAFEYKDNYYFGETKFIEPEEKDNTISTGELVDLGLSVKWASCNVGAETPSQLGTKIKTDIISEAYKSNPSLFNEDGTKADFCRSGYDLAYKQSAGRMRMPTYQELKELKEKCQWELSVVDGVAGARIVGPNKNSIFLPADTEKTEQPYFGDSYMLNRTVYTSGTYDKNEISWSWDLASILIYGMYMPQLSMSSFLNIEFGNDFEAYIRPVGN